MIVKKMQNGSYEVVDGQQRLTTIYIFMKIAQQEIRSAVPPFELSYQTREESARFCRNCRTIHGMNVPILIFIIWDRLT